MKTLLILLMMTAFCSCSTTIYLTRHAEKETAAGAMNANDPALTEDGKIRAKKLADSLTGNLLQGVYATPYKRTQQTAQPTAIIMALPVTTYAANGGDALLDSLIKQKNRRFLVVGHSNTIPAMLRHIGLTPSMENIPDNDYDNLFVVKLKWGFGRKISLTEKTYGKVSP